MCCRERYRRSVFDRRRLCRRLQRDGDDAQCRPIELLLQIAEAFELKRLDCAQRFHCDAPDVQPFEAELGLFEGVHRAAAPFTNSPKEPRHDAPRESRSRFDDGRATPSDASAARGLRRTIAIPEAALAPAKSATGAAKAVSAAGRFAWAEVCAFVVVGRWSWSWSWSWS